MDTLAIQGEMIARCCTRSKYTIWIIPRNIWCLSCIRYKIIIIIIMSCSLCGTPSGSSPKLGFCKFRHVFSTACLVSKWFSFSVFYTASSLTTSPFHFFPLSIRTRRRFASHIFLFLIRASATIPNRTWGKPRSPSHSLLLDHRDFLCTALNLFLIYPSFFNLVCLTLHLARKQLTAKTIIQSH